MRLDAAGSVDASFARPRYTVGGLYAAGLLVEPSGSFFVLAPNSLARFASSGARDVSFIGVADAYDKGPIAYPGGKLLTMSSATTFDAKVRRLLPTGAVDPSWGSAGVVGASSIGTTPYAIVAEDSGAVLVGGWSDGDQSRLVRLTNGGALDPTFGDAGVVSFTVATSNQPSGVYAVHLSGPKRLLAVAGTSMTGDQSPRFQVRRFWR